MTKFIKHLVPAATAFAMLTAGISVIPANAGVTAMAQIGPLSSQSRTIEPGVHIANWVSRTNKRIADSARRAARTAERNKRSREAAEREKKRTETETGSIRGKIVLTPKN